MKAASEINRVESSRRSKPNTSLKVSVDCEDRDEKAQNNDE